MRSQSRSREADRAWFWATAPAAAWAVHGLGSVFISWQACTDRDADWGILSGSEVRGLMAAITLALFAVAVIGVVVSFRRWQRMSEQPRFVEAEGRGHPEFVALGGTFFGAAFALGILWGGLPLALLDVCMRAR